MTDPSCVPKTHWLQPSRLCSSPPSLPIGAGPNGGRHAQEQAHPLPRRGLLAGATYALSACTLVRGVNTAGSTNMGDAPGTANDLATGGQGGRNDRAVVVAAAAAADETDRTASPSSSLAPGRSWALDRAQPVRLSTSWRGQPRLAPLADDNAIDG